MLSQTLEKKEMIYASVDVYLTTEDKTVFLKEIDQRAHQEIYHQEYSEVL